LFPPPRPTKYFTGEQICLEFLQSCATAEKSLPTWQEWRAYTGGILNPGNCEEPQDHAMSIVGYGSEANGDKFWLLKNSWGDHLQKSLLDFPDSP
jgi:hypothetical protein